MQTPQIHAVHLRAEWETEGFRCRVLHLDACGDPECECAFIDGDPLRAFAAPFRGTTDEWLYMGLGSNLDSIALDTSDTLAADTETPPTIMDRAAALFGVSWELVKRRPVVVLGAQAKQVASLDGKKTTALLSKSIAELRAIKVRGHGERIERQARSNGAL